MEENWDGGQGLEKELSLCIFTYLLNFMLYEILPIQKVLKNFNNSKIFTNAPFQMESAIE